MGRCAKTASVKLLPNPLELPVTNHILDIVFIFMTQSSGRFHGLALLKNSSSFVGKLNGL